MKQCRECKQTLKFLMFSKKKESKDGYSGICKKCHNKYSREVWYPKNRAKQKESNRKYKLKNHTAIKAKLYGCSEDTLKKIIKDSDGACAICYQKIKLVIDHCHESGKVRGMLCSSCNRGIGFLQDNAEILESAAKYITKHAD